MSNTTTAVPTFLSTSWEAAAPYVPQSIYGQVLALLAAFPFVAIVLNVLRQLVRRSSRIPNTSYAYAQTSRYCPGTPKLPDQAPEVFHLIPLFGVIRYNTATTPSIFFKVVAKRCAL